MVLLSNQRNWFRLPPMSRAVCLCFHIRSHYTTRVIGTLYVGFSNFGMSNYKVRLSGQDKKIRGYKFQRHGVNSISLQRSLYLKSPSQINWKTMQSERNLPVSHDCLEISYLSRACRRWGRTMIRVATNRPPPHASRDFPGQKNNGCFPSLFPLFPVASCLPFSGLGMPHLDSSFLRHW